ncbi:MAG: COX15/CtaA family protein, partial [Chloroflexota bacterium]
MINLSANHKTLKRIALSNAILALILPAISSQSLFQTDLQLVFTGYLIVLGIASLLTIALISHPQISHFATTKIRALLLGLAFIQAPITFGMILSNYHPSLAALHLLSQLAYSGLSLYLVTALYLKQPIEVANNWRIFNFLSWTGGAIALLLVTGLAVTGTSSGSACPDWPLCQGQIFPENYSWQMGINLIHRFTVVAVSVLIGALILQVRRYYPQDTRLIRWSAIIGWLFLAQIGSGAMYLLAIPSVVVTALHLTLAIAVWGSFIVLAGLCYLTNKALPSIEVSQQAAPVVEATRREKAKTYFKMTKPWILVLLLLTTLTTMFIAAEGLPPISLMLYTFLGGVLSAGGASVLNSYVDSTTVNRY